MDASAYAGVLLALLFLFMAVGANTRDLPRNVAQLPRVSHPVPLPGANRDDAIRVTVQRDGTVWLGEEMLMAGDLSARIRQKLSRGAERRVYIEADGHARYGAVLEVLDAIRSAGVEKVSFLVYPSKAPSLKR